MIPDLGKYAVAVLGSYAAGLFLIAVLIGVSVWQAKRARRALEQAERQLHD